MASEEVVGGIVGFLRMDADQFHREVTRAIAEVKVLKGMDANVKIKATGTRSVERDLLRVGAAAKGAGANVNGLGQSFESGGMASGPLIVGGLAAGMALLGPVTGAATAAMGGFVGVVGTGVLAFKGLQDQVERGTALGKILQGQVDGIKGEFAALGTTAAGAMAGDVVGSLRQVQEFLPTINQDVETLAGHLGRALNTSTKGLITGLENAMPLLQDGGHYAEVLADKFAEFTASQDFKDFIDYARSRLPEVTDAFVSLGTGIKDLAVGLAPAGDNLVYLINLFGGAASAIGKSLSFLESINLDNFNKQVAELMGRGPETEKAAGAVETYTSKVHGLLATQSPLAAGLGITDQALQAAAETHRNTAGAADAATTAMQYEGNAAGLLKQSLDILNGKTLDVASAQTTAASATLSLTSSMKENGTTLSTNTEKGVANRRAIEQKVRADQALAEAVAESTGSTKKGTESLKDNKAKLEDTLRSQGRLTDKVQAYIDKLYKVPKKVPPTKLEVEKAQAQRDIAAFQKAIDSLHGKTVTAQVHYAYTGRLPNGGMSLHGGLTFRDGGQIPGYASGTIVGPGTGTSDSILAQVAETGRALRVSAGEFISTDASRRRNQAALEAGNKGATLAVAGRDGAGIDYDRMARAFAREVAHITLTPTVSVSQIDSIGRLAHN